MVMVLADSFLTVWQIKSLLFFPNSMDFITIEVSGLAEV